MRRRILVTLGFFIVLFFILVIVVACTNKDIQPQPLTIGTTIEQKGFSRYFNYAFNSLILTLEGQASRIEIIAGEEQLQLDAMAIMKLPAFITDMDLPNFLIIAWDEEGRELKRIQVNLPQIEISQIRCEERDEAIEGDGYYYYDASEGLWKFYSTVDLTAMSAAERMQIHQDTEHFDPKYVVFNHQYTTLEDYEEKGTEADFIELQPPFPEEAFNIPESVSFDPYTQQIIVYQPPTITLTSPADQTAGDQQIVTLTWEATPGSREDGEEGNAVQLTEYQIFLTIEGNPFPTQPAFVIEDKGQKSYTTNLLEMGTVYQWKVTAVQSDGASAMSSERTFSVGLQTQVYTLTIEASPTKAGSVAGGGVFEGEGQRFSSWTGSFAEGEEVNIQAIPKSGYRFIQWKKGDFIVSEQATDTYTMPGEDIELVAEFEAIIHEYVPPQIQLISPNDNQSDLATTVILTWEATAGIQFNADKRELATIEAYHVYFANADQAYPDPLEVTGKEKNKQNLEFNTTYKWKVEVIQSDGARTMSSERTFTVREEVNLYTLTLKASPTGCGSVAAGGVFELLGQRFSSWTGSFAEGDEVTIQAIPAVDYLFIGWTNGTSTISEETGYTYTMPREDVDLTAEFEAIMYDYNTPQVQLISPSDNECNMATTVTLTWNATPGQLIILNERQEPELTEFRIFFGEDTNWSEPYATMVGESTPMEYTLNGLDYDQQYMWTIEVLQSDSKTASSSVRTFSTEAKQYSPPQIAIVSPSSGSTNTSKDVTLTWEATPGQQNNIAGRGSASIDEYHLYVSPSDQDYPIDPIVVIEKEKSMENLDFNTLYKWKVEALQIDGATQTTQEATFLTEQEMVFLFKDDVLIASYGSIYQTISDIENDQPHVIKVTGGTTLYEPDESIVCNKKVTITSTNGQPFTINLRGINRAFSLITDAQITLENAVVMNGNSPESGGAVFVDTSTSFTTHNCTFTNNHGVTGGAIYVRNGGQFYSENTSITQNSATQGGGVYLALLNSWDPAPIFSATQTIISYNTGEGGIYIYSNSSNSAKSSVSATQTTISHNIGGGILINGGSFRGYECDITDNYENQEAIYDENKGGSGIYIRSGTATLINSQIINNQAWRGGGVRIGDDKNAEFYANNVLISDNTAVDGGGIYIEGSTTGTSPLVKYWEGHFYANEVEIKGNTASNQGGGIYRSVDGAWGKIYTGGIEWFETWCQAHIKENFSVGNDGYKSGTFSLEDPITVYDNIATDDDRTNQLRRWTD